MLQTRFKQVKEWINQNELTKQSSQNIVNEMFSEVEALQWCEEFTPLIEYLTTGQVRIEFFTYGYQCEIKAPTLVKAIAAAKAEVERIGKHFEEIEMEDEN